MPSIRKEMGTSNAPEREHKIMRSGPLCSTRPRAEVGAFVFSLLALVAVLFPWATASAQTPVTAGYRDFNYGSTVTPATTGEKPESKVWWNDGSWWGSLWNNSALAYHIYRFDLPTQTWVDTGTVIDTRTDSKSDALWDQTSQELYIVSHRFTSDGAPSSTQSSWGRLYRYSYSSTTKAYTLDSGFPVNVTRGIEETLVIAKDSLGELWVTYVENSKVMINHSDGNDLTWGTPFVLPVSSTATSVTSDDISSVIAFQGNKIGVMWSNQNTRYMYFSVHNDADADNVWQPEEVADPNSDCSGACADDHINLKTDSTGRVYAATKTSLTGSTDVLNMLNVRSTAGTWTGYTFGLEGNHQTRAIVVLDETNSKVYVVASPEGGGVIYYKVSGTSNISFPTGLGTVFIKSSTE